MNVQLVQLSIGVDQNGSIDSECANDFDTGNQKAGTVIIWPILMDKGGGKALFAIVLENIKHGC